MARTPSGLVHIALALTVPLASCAPQEHGRPDRVFVSDEAGNVVMVLDGSTGKVEGQLRTGRRPRGMAFSPDRRIIYVAASNDDRIEAWDARRLRHLRNYQAGSDPERFAVSPDGSSIYIANEDRSIVSRLDLATGRMVWEAPVGPEPEGIAVSPDGRTVVATAETSSTVHFIGAASGRVVTSAMVGSRPRDALFRSGAPEIWVSSEQRGTISVFDARALKPLGTIDLVPAFADVEQVQAIEMSETRDGKRVFVAMGRSDRVAEIDPATRTVIRSFPTGHRTWGLALSPDNTRLYAASGLSGDVTVIDLVRNRVARTVDLGGKPWGVEAMPR